MKDFNNIYYDKIQSERNSIYKSILGKNFSDAGQIKLLEIGAGSGSNLPFFLELGLLPENIYANEILPERIDALHRNFPKINVLPGYSQDLNLPEKSFDLIFQSTVFSSVLQANARQDIARCMLKWLKSGGMILWYDFIYNNPSNPNVRKVSKQEIISLFPNCKYVFHKVTLLPPLGRRVRSAYSLFNALPFLRTHLIVEIYP